MLHFFNKNVLIWILRAPDSAASGAMLKLYLAGLLFLETSSTLAKNNALQTGLLKINNSLIEACLKCRLSNKTVI